MSEKIKCKQDLHDTHLCMQTYYIIYSYIYICLKKIYCHSFRMLYESLSNTFLLPLYVDLHS